MSWTRSRYGALVVLVVAGLLSALSLYFGSRITINTSLRALLPEHAASLQAIAAVQEAQGATDRLTVAIEGPDPAQNRKLGQRIAKALKNWPESESVTSERDLRPFRDHALYFLSIEDLQDLHAQLQGQVQREVLRQTGTSAQAGKIDLSKLKVQDEDWDQEYEQENEQDSGQNPEPNPGQKPAAPSPPKSKAQAQTEETPTQTSPQDLSTSLDKLRQRFLQDPRLAPHEAAAIWPPADEKGGIPWPQDVVLPLQNESGTVQVVQARLSKAPTDVRFAQEVNQRVQALAQELLASPAAPKTRIEVVGSYAISNDIDTIMVDLRNATLLSVALVCAVLALGFRTWKALPIIVLPVAVSMAITLALAQLMFAQLNVLTAFLFAVLFGMGVDFSVHLYAQSRAQAPQPRDWAALVTKHIRPLAATMLTTAGALWALCFGEFRAFYEFGLISGIGVATCLLVALFLVPALDILLSGTRRRAAFDPGPNRDTSSATPQPTPPADHLDKPASYPRWRIIAIATCLLFSLVFAPKVAFENNTRKLRSSAPAGANTKRSIPYGDALGKKSSGVPVVMLGETAAGLDQAVQDLQAIADRESPSSSSSASSPAPWVKSVLSVQKVLPEQPAAKAKIIQQLATLSERLLPATQDPAAQNNLRTLQKLAAASPMRAKDLPAWVLQPFSTRDGDPFRIAHAHLRFQESDLIDVRRVVRSFRELCAPQGVVGATSSFVLADLGRLIEKDTGRLPFFALAVIALCLALDLRKASAILICFLTLCLGLALSLGLLGALDIKINFFNLAVMPAVVGLGIDASIHLWHSRHRPHFDATAKASLIAACTTAAAFAGLLAAHNPGLRSMAHLGLIAIAACVGVAFLVLGSRARRG